MRVKIRKHSDGGKGIGSGSAFRGRFTMAGAVPDPRAASDPRASHDDGRPHGGRDIFEALLLAAVPIAMGVALVAGFAQTALLMMLVVTVVLALFFAGYEASKPALRQIMPTLVLAALAAAGRILFAPIPDFKPVSAIAIIAGATLGRRSGFMVGALAALASNFFFGQGLWSPWQMYAWGLIGYLGGVLADRGVFPDASASREHRVNGKDGDSAPLASRVGRSERAKAVLLVAFGLLSGLLYGMVINAYGVLGFVRPLTVPGAIAYVAASLPFDVVHGVATAVFLLVLYRPWTLRIARVVRKFDVRCR